MARKTRRKKRIAERINQHILKKGDICCVEDYNREKIIEKIFQKYERLWEGTTDNYLDWISNDIGLFIGVKGSLLKNGDKEGANLWDALDKRTTTRGRANKDKIEKLLRDLPIYYLLAFLGNVTLSEPEN